MPLTQHQRQRLQDCHLLIESARKTLSGIESERLPELEEIQQCCRSAEKAIAKALDQ